MTQDPSSPVRRGARPANVRVAAACDRCRSRKVRCDGSKPCRACAGHLTQCHYAPRTMKGRLIPKDQERELKSKLQQADIILQMLRRAASNSSAEVGDGDSTTATLFANASDGPKDIAEHWMSTEAVGATASVIDECASTDSIFRNNDSFQDYVSIPDNIADHQLNSNVSSITCNGNDILSQLQDQASNATLGDTDNIRASNPTFKSPDTDSEYEFHGASSCLSICEGSGIEWIASRLDSSTCISHANALLKKVQQRFKLSEPLKPERTLEPSFATAWRYSQAYFDDSFEASFYTIDRAIFESHLRERYKNQKASDDSHVWYALRNVVYAYGCRILLAKEISWAKAQDESWKYFENALCVETDLIHCVSDLSSIRALVAMALFTEGAGSLKLEYMLISAAVRLAQSKGLHLKPRGTSSLSRADLESRSWLFWTIYYYDKKVALRSGRPSAINDDDISVDLPAFAPDGNLQRLRVFRHIVEHALIVSEIISGLMTVKARRKPIDQSVAQIRDLDHRMRVWYEGISPILRPKSLADSGNLPPGLCKEHIQYIFMAYHGSLAAIHTMLAYPWRLSQKHQNIPTSLHTEMEKSVMCLAEASRNLILGTKAISIDGPAPIWATVYYPLLGAMNLFIYILTNLSLPTISRDIGLLDMVVGYFGYFDILTGFSLSHPFPSQISMWARASVADQNNNLGILQAILTHSDTEKLDSTIYGNNIPDTEWNAPSWFPSLSKFTQADC